MDVKGKSALPLTLSKNKHKNCVKEIHVKAKDLPCPRFPDQAGS
jgi:hypothetical protein